MSARPWRTTRLGEGLSVRHGFAFKGEHFAAEGSKIVLTPGNFKEAGGFKFKTTEKYYEGPVPGDYVLAAGDVVLAMTEQSRGLLGSTATIPESPIFLHNQRIGLLQVTDPEVLDLRFCYHLLNAPEPRRQIQATATGSKVRHTAPERIESIVVPLPCVEYQRLVASFLDAFDDLIENNRRRIEILEEMARLIYREWFVHFRFPGHEDVELVDSALGPIPAGWEVGVFDNLVNLQKQSVAPEGIPTGAALVGLEHLPRRSVTLTEWAVADDVGSRKSRFEAGDILFGKIRPYFHKVVRAPLDGFCSTDAIVFRPANGCAARALVAASSDDFVAYAVQSSNGTKMPRANTELLLQYPLPLPTSSVAQRFEATVEPMVELCQNLAKQNRVLAEARDLLLPRLISGELDVSDRDLDLPDLDTPADTPNPADPKPTSAEPKPTPSPIESVA